MGLRKPDSGNQGRILTRGTPRREPKPRTMSVKFKIVQKLSLSKLLSVIILKLDEVRKWIEENMFKGFIQNSSSSCAALILFVKKKDGNLRLCFNYRALNDITIKRLIPATKNRRITQPSSRSQILYLSRPPIRIQPNKDQTR